MADSAVSSAPPAGPRPQICALCTTPARYKCPRCATLTCSLLCSRKHKQDTRCTGERDKVQFVPMNAYGWGSMMRDYCYLEDVGKKVGEWGSEIVRGGYAANISASNTASARRSSGKKKSAAGRSKRDWLRVHLETMGIDVEFLPPGMERRNMNQSTFDQRSRSALLTIEFVFYPPTSLPSSPPSYKILSHRNGLSATFLSILQHQVSLALSKSQKQKESTPDWLLPMVAPRPEAPKCFVPPHCYICANTEFPRPPNTVYYHKLDPTLELDKLLQKTSFIEFPTIHVFDPKASSFFGTIIDNSGTIIGISEDDRVDVSRKAKQRKLDHTVDPEAVFNLISQYGSETGSQSEEEKTKWHQTGLANLEAYSESDEARTDSGESDIDGPTEGYQLDPMKLLELAKLAQSAADEDILDWGDESDAVATQ